MKLVDSGVMERDKEFIKLCKSLFDIEDDDDLEEMAHAMLGTLMFCAHEWNPYHVLGLMHCTMAYIQKMLDGELDGEE